MLRSLADGMNVGSSSHIQLCGGMPGGASGKGGLVRGLSNSGGLGEEEISNSRNSFNTGRRFNSPPHSNMLKDHHL